MKTLKLTKKQIHTGNLILVNEKYKFRNYNDIELKFAGLKKSSIQMEKNASNVLSRILCSVDSKDKIVPVSGFRPKEEQEQIYADSLKENGQEFTKKFVALPQHSEHETGLAIDLGLKKEVIDFIRPDFPYHGICNEFRKIAPKYGFIERYQNEKESKTGIAHEPWHFRYVGYPHSEIMREKDLCLEEYIEYIKKYTYNSKHLKITNEKQNIDIFYVPLLDSKQVTINLPEKCDYQVSGNNADGFIVTCIY